MKLLGKENVIKRALVLILAAIMVISSAIPAFAAGDATGNYEFQKYSDSTDSLITNQLQTSTQNNGNIWVDKSVSSTSLPLADENGNVIKNDALVADKDSFVVGLSAMSQAYEKTIETQTEIKKTANVAIVIDLSTSMTTCPVSKDETSKRLDLLKTVGQQFVDSLYETAKKGYTINACVIMYGGIAKVTRGWTVLDAKGIADIKSTIKSEKPGSYKDNTNFTAPLALARYMFTGKPAPANYADANTNNYVIFMSDGAANRGYSTDVKINESSYANGLYASTSESGITRTIVSTDFRSIAATSALDEVGKIHDLKNMTLFSLGLGGWFTTASEDSEFPTAPNLMKLIAAVGNGIITAEEAKQYVGEDIPDGGMNTPNKVIIAPTYPYFEFTDKDGNEYNSYSCFLENNKYCIKMVGKTLSYGTNLEALKAGIDEKIGTVEEREKDGIFRIPDSITASVFNYYAGNTVEKFTNSFSEISTSITTSLNNYVTNTTKSSEDALPGNVTIIDNVGEYMQMSENGGLRGVFFDGKLYTGASCAEAAVERLTSGSNYSEKEYEEFRKIIRNYFHVQMTNEQIQNWLDASLKGGDFRYASDKDFNCRITAYTGYDHDTHQLVYKGMYYDENGNVNPVPDGATYITRQYFILDSVSWKNIVGESDVSMFHLGMLCSTKLDDGKQTITFSIPANLLPTREVVVSDGVAKAINTAIPITMVYDVKIKDDFFTARADYPYFTDDGDAILYTNKWSENKNSNDNTFAVYSPNPMNPYYLLQEDSPIYKKSVENGEEVYTLVAKEDFELSGDYYYLHTFTDESGACSHYDSIHDYFEIGTDELVANEDGFMCIPRGTVKNTTYSHTSLKKARNITSTYGYSYDPSYSILADGTVYVRAVLGNNGALIIPKTTVSVEQVWEDGNENHENDEVKVQLYAKDSNGNEVPVGEPVTITAEDNWKYEWNNVSSVDNNGEKIEYTKCRIVDSTSGACVSEEPITWNENTKNWEPAVIKSVPAECNYEYYLTDNEGNPIDEDGTIVDFDNRVIVQESKSENVTSCKETTITASETFTEDENYLLLDSTASYSVMASGVNNDNGGYANINGLGTVIADHDDKYISSTVSFAVKKVNLNPDAVVIDYGKSVLIDVTANDTKSNNSGIKLVALSNTAFGEIEAGTGYSQNVLSSNTSVNTKYGKADVVKSSGKYVVKYTPTTYMEGIDSFWYVTKDTSKNGYYRYEKVSVIPATSMFYEDNFGDSESTYICYTGEWETIYDIGLTVDGVEPDGTKGGYQDTSYIGSGDNYGYDSSYAFNGRFSNGSAAVVIGTSRNDGKGGIANETSAKFKFTGTGFELTSRTSADCGMITVYVEDENGNAVANVPVFNKGTSTLYQIPVIRCNGLTYGTYTVKINVSAPISLPGLTGSSVFYLDGIRVYDPLGTTSTDNKDFDEANEAYDKDNEANSVIESLRDKIIISSKKQLSFMSWLSGIIWLDTFDDSCETSGTVSTDKISDYVSYGPNEEVYLAAGNAIGFEFTTPEIPASVQISAKAPNNIAELSVYTYGSKNVYTHSINTSSEMYYDVTKYIDLKQNADGTYTGTVMIYNSEWLPTSLNVLSVKDLKITYKNNKIVKNEMKSNLNTYSTVYNTVRMARNASVAPAYEINSVKVDNTKAYAYGDRAVINFNASEKIDSYAIFDSLGNVVIQQSSKSVVDEKTFISDECGYAKIWTIGFDVANTRSGDYTIVGYSDGEQCCAAEFSINVEKTLVSEGIAVNDNYDGKVVVDNENGLIYGLEANAMSLEDYIYADDGYRFEVEMPEGVVGTGTIVKLYNSNNKLVKTYTVLIYGDAMGDGSIDAFDIAVLGEWVNNSVDISSLGAVGIALDVNGDGCLDSYDYSILIAAANYEVEINQNGEF